MANKKVSAPALFESEADAQRRRDANYDNEMQQPENTDVIMVDGKPELLTFGVPEIGNSVDVAREIVVHKSAAIGISEPYEKPFRISQSMMKAVRAYLDGGDCGLVIREKYINGRLFGDATKAMKLGTYFEYILTGSLPKDGKVPQPEYKKMSLNAQEKIIKDNKKAVDDNVKIRQYNAHLKPTRKPKKIKEIKPEKVLGPFDMYEPYQEAHANAVTVRKMWAEMGLEIATGKDGKLLSGWTVVKGRFVGTIDVVLRATRDITFADGFTLKEGDLISADLKYSGLKDDKWSVHGWQWTPEQKRYHGTQAKHYKMLTGLEQTFWIVDPKGNYVLFFRCVISEQAINAHIDEANELYKRLIELDELESLEPRPEVNKCADCVLFSECTFKHTFPHPVAVDLTN